MHIYVKTPTGRTISLKVHRSDTLYTIKAKIQEQHCLVFNGVQLDQDSLTLADYDIEHGSTIDLQEKMQIYVMENLSGKKIALEVDSLDTIDKVKCRIQDWEGFPKGNQCLIFGNKQLDDDELTLADHNIWKGSTLLLVLQPSRLIGTAMRIYVKTLTAKYVPLDVEDSDTIDDLKVKVYVKEGIPLAQQRLIFAGRKLEGQRTLAYYNIKDDATIHLAICLCGC